MDFKILFDQAPFGIVVIDVTGEISLVNKSFCDILGYTSKELLKMPYKNLVHPDFLEYYLKEFDLLVTEKSTSIEMVKKCLSRRNQIVKVIFKVNLVKARADELPMFVAEIAEIKDLQPGPFVQTADREDNIIYLNALMERSPDLIYFKNKKSQLIKISDSYVEKFGRLTNQFIGKTDFDLFTKEHAQKAFDDEQQIVKMGSTIINIEERETAVNGTITWASTSKMPLRNMQGEIIGTFGISRDITQRKIQDEELREKNNILNAITSNMPIVVYKYNKESGVIPLYGNSNLTHVFEKSKMVKLSISESLPLIIKKIYSQKNTQGYMTFPSTYTSQEEEWYFENFVFESESNNEEYIGLALDITSRKQIEHNVKRNSKNLEKLNKELNQFSYIVSHDLKAPLRAVTNLSEWIEEDLKDFDNNETKENLKLMRGRIRRMENLINGILIYSRVSRVTIEYQEINVRKLIQEIIESLAISDKFVVTVSEILPSLVYPLVNLEQIFSNLLSNAVKYHNKPNGHIEIGYRDTPEFHEFWVGDDGPGIAPDYHEKVFQIFQTLQARDTVESTGIGLTIVKKIIEERGGSIWIESEVGKGAKFIFTIPKEPSKNLSQLN